MKIKTDKKNIILIPENEKDIFYLGTCCNKISIEYAWHYDALNKSEKLTEAKIELKHLLTLLKINIV